MYVKRTVCTWHFCLLCSASFLLDVISWAYRRTAACASSGRRRVCLGVANCVRCPPPGKSVAENNGAKVDGDQTAPSPQSKFSNARQNAATESRSPDMGLTICTIEHFSQTFAHIKLRVLIQLYLVPEMLILDVRHFSGPRPAVFAGKPGPGGGGGVLSPPPRSSDWGLLLRAGGCVKVPTVTLARTRNPQTVRHS